SRSQARDAAHSAALEAMAEQLRCDARSWAAQVRTMSELSDLSVLGAKAGVPQFGQLEMAGSWSVSQLTASRWQEEAERFVTALPQTLALLETGQLLRHQAVVLLHRTRHCTVEVAGKVEAEVLPAATGWCPADIGRRVDRVVLRIESEQADAAAAEQRHADAAAERRTFTRPELDGMGLAGAVLTAEQLVGWSAGMDSLERRERVADRRAGIDRTAPQRRADLFAALPAMVLAGRAGNPDCASTDIVPMIVLNVHVPMASVLELSGEPGSMNGYGPVSAARPVAAPDTAAPGGHRQRDRPADRGRRQDQPGGQ
ncbi:MAG: 13E12 repeat family protein, partial [Actinomycetota bacterium]|nr:13E12 repeat family protein [Actinomycetota bacterium]